jgi:hypothetical protein
MNRQITGFPKETILPRQASLLTHQNRNKKAGAAGKLSVGNFCGLQM